MGLGAEGTEVTGYAIYVRPSALKEIKDLPGNFRQRIRRAVSGLAENPRPPKSKTLNVSEVAVEVRRLRMDRWRLIYAITESDLIVDVLALRKRPPYDYGDLTALLTGMDDE
jgi:mRNA interferase RelE/StbE